MPPVSSLLNVRAPRSTRRRWHYSNETALRYHYYLKVTAVSASRQTAHSKQAMSPSQQRCQPPTHQSNCASQLRVSPVLTSRTPSDAHLVPLVSGDFRTGKLQLTRGCFITPHPPSSSPKTANLIYFLLFQRPALCPRSVL